MEKIVVFGTGYVGLVTGTCLSDLGHDVVCVDTDISRIDALHSGKVPFYEPGLSDIVFRNVRQKRLEFTTDFSLHYENCDIFFIAVGTPQDDNGCADTSYVFSVIDDLMDKARVFPGLKKIIVTKSTVPVGTGRKIMEIVKNNSLDDLFSVVSNPEFLREGSAVDDFFRPDRVVIGSECQIASDRVSSLYSSLYRNRTPVIKTSLESSELSKYASNAFLATKVSFINEIAQLCDATGADVKDIANIMGKDGRIGEYFLHPGPGYGGSCFPKDVQAIIAQGKNVNIDLKISTAVSHVNFVQKSIALQQLKKGLHELNGKKVGIFGVSFKPNTDDIRESSSIYLIQELLKKNVEVVVCDPEAIENTRNVYGASITYASNAYECSEDVDAVVLMTEWHSFRGLDLSRILTLMEGNIFVDMRNVYDPGDLEKVGFLYYSVGRSTNIF
jgi:UDPglucose 6-dehydrogenase